MAFAKRYIARLASADGLAYQAWLHEDGYGGSADPVRLASDLPCAITWGASGSDIYAPMLGSKAVVAAWRLTDELADLVGARTGTYRLEIVRGADQAAIDAATYETVWLGQVLADIFQDSTMGGPVEVDVEAICGLGTLKEIPYYDTVTSPPDRIAYTGRETLLEILRTALGKTGYDLPVRSALAWRPSSVMGSEDPLAEIDVDQLSFYSADGRAMSCYDVAEEIARRFGARLFQWGAEGDEAAWWIVSRELMTGTAYTVFKYDAAGAADGTTTYGAGADSAGAGVVRTAGTRSFRPAWGRAAVVQNHGPIPPLVDEGDFALNPYKPKGYWWLTVRADFVSGSWTYNGAAYAREADPDLKTRYGPDSSVNFYTLDDFLGTNRPAGTQVAERNFVHAVPSAFHGTSLDPDTIKSVIVAGGNYAVRTGGIIDEGQTITFAGKVTIEHNAGEGRGLFNACWTLYVPAAGLHLQRDGTWASSASEAVRTQYLADPGAIFGQGGFNLETVVPFKITSAPFPMGFGSGPIELKLWGSSDVNGADLDPGDTLWDEVAVVVTDTAGVMLGAQRTEVFTAQPDGAREEIVVVTGQGPAQTLPTTMQVSGANVEDWSSARLAAVRPLDELHAETVLRSQLAPLALRQETYRGLALDPATPIMASSVAYVPQMLTLNLYHQEAQGEFVELQWDGATTSDAESASTDPPGTTYVSQAGGGTLGISNELSVITTKGDLIAGNAGGEEERHPVGTDGQLLTADSTADRGVAWADAAVQSPITTKGDLVAGDASGDEDRLPVGVDGQVLKADASAGLGVAWQDATPEDELAEALAPKTGRITVTSGNQTASVVPGFVFSPYTLQLTPWGLPEAGGWGIDTSLTDETTIAVKLSASATQDNDFNWMVFPNAVPVIDFNLTVEDEGDGYVTLSWNEVEAVDGYKLYYDTDPGAPYANVIDITVADLADAANPEWTVTGLTNGTVYYFAVTAYTNLGQTTRGTAGEGTRVTHNSDDRITT